MFCVVVVVTSMTVQKKTTSVIVDKKQKISFCNHLRQDGIIFSLFSSSFLLVFAFLFSLPLIFPQPAAPEVFFMHSLEFSYSITFFIWQHSSFLHFSPFANFHKPYCAIKPSISKLFDSLLYPFLVILFFSPSIILLFASLAGTLPSSRVWVLFHHFAKFFGVPFVPIHSISPAWSHSLPRISRTLSAPCQNFSLPVHSSDKGHDLTNDDFTIFLIFSTRILVQHICLACSCICFLFRISHIDTYPLPRTTLFDASFPHSSHPRKSTFLSALA